MEILEQWQQGLLIRTAMSIPRLAVGNGECIAHLGPRNDFARIRLRFEPADSFVVLMEGVPNEPESLVFVQAALFGALDVLTTYTRHPVLKVRVVVEQMEVDEINSNELAFRLAGRDAARKALESCL